MPNNQQDRNKAPSISRKAASSGNKLRDTPKHTPQNLTQLCSSEGKDTAPSTSPFHKEASTSPWTNLTDQGAEQQKRNYGPEAPVKRTDHKLDKMRQQRRRLQTKEQDKNTQNQIN